MRYNLNINAKTKWGKLLQLCMLAAIPAFFGCANDGDGIFEGDTVPMTLYLQASGAHQTRAYIEELAAEETESNINTAQVWFFDGETPISYATSNSNKVTINVPQAAINKGTVDAYIIANAGGALSATLGENSTLAEIQAATLAATQFGTATPVTNVPDAGLPMSRIVKGLELTQGGEVKPNLGEIEITRAVSKIIFAFGMYDGDLGDIIGISLDGGQIADKEHILAVDPATNAADYTTPYLGDLKSNITAGSYEAAELIFGATTGTTPLVANADIFTTTTNDNPSNYTWVNWIADSEIAPLSDKEKARLYYTAITPFTTHKVYLRESDKKLKGTIYYRLGSDATAEVKTVTFEMDPESTVQDFARNHVWIVYSYFEGGKLYVKPTVADWIDADELKYTMKMSTSMRLFDSWLYRYDTVDQDYTNWTNWAGSHMVVSDGRVETPVAPEVVAGRPLRSPQIQLVTTGVTGSSFELVVDNDDFEIVHTVKNTTTGEITAYELSTDGVLTIPEGDNIYTYFYIVPKDGVTPANPEAKVSLFYNDPVLGKQEVTFNYNSLPGYSDDSSEIWVYYVTPENYNITDKLKMYYQDSNNPLVPTPVQD